LNRLVVGHKREWGRPVGAAGRAILLRLRPGEASERQRTNDARLQNERHLRFPPDSRSATRNANQHLLPIVEGDLLAPVERGSAESSGAADDRPNPGSLTPSEDSAQQGASSRPDGGMSDAFPPLPPDSIAPSTSTFSPDGAW
jgi:hypothetical protein